MFTDTNVLNDDESQVKTRFYFDKDNKLAYIKTIFSQMEEEKLKIEISTEKGIRNFNMVSSNFSEIFGPVEKGFTASINAYLASQSTAKEFTIRIYVCKGNEPFALKAYNYSTENSNSIPLSAIYTIDY